jgi:hypothetical protein
VMFGTDHQSPSFGPNKVTKGRNSSTNITPIEHPGSASPIENNLARAKHYIR